MRRLLPALAAIWIAVVAASHAGAVKFYPDDPIAREPNTQDASGVKPWVIDDVWDFVENSFVGIGDHSARRAMNVNTVDEVPDSSWFTNRIGATPMSVEEIVKGPDHGTGPTPGPWTVISSKHEGITPGMTIRDSTGEIYFIKFDPPSNPEMATGAEIISTKFFFALGFEVPENHLATLRRENLKIGENALVTRADGRRRGLREGDLDTLLTKGARNADGSYRVLASKALVGKPVGPFRYYDTRPDDPNDIVPHEHRRELRGLRVFAAWLNHDDSRSINSLDTLVQRGGRTIVQHHLIDFGSTLGSGSVAAQDPRAGNEYIWDRRAALLSIFTFGVYVRPWIWVNYPNIPAAGRIESDVFEPDTWKPEYPNPAFDNSRPDDTFWAAGRVAAIPEEAIKAVVHAARYTDPKAEQYVIDVITSRRRKVCSYWLNDVNPLVSFVMDASGGVTFENAAVTATMAPPASEYRVKWFSFDNTTGAETLVGPESRTTEARVQAPAEILRSDYVLLETRAIEKDHPRWASALRVYFRRTASGWQTVGLERWPDHPVEMPTMKPRSRGADPGGQRVRHG